MTRLLALVMVSALAVGACAGGADEIADEVLVTVPLAYQKPGDGPGPNFSPKGMQVPLALVAADVALPAGAIRPAKMGALRVGPEEAAWVPVLATADPEHPADFTRLFFDRNRNGDFGDDGPAFEATPSQNEKTRDWWTSFSDIEFDVPYGGDSSEPFLINAWIVRDGDATPDIMRFSRRSWRSGQVDVNGVPALVAAMDADNDALFTDQDTWSVLAAGTPDAAKAVLSIAEAKPAARMMFVADAAAARELVLEFRSITPDGRSLTFAVVDRPMTKAEDRAADDTLAAERPRPRAATPVVWLHNLDEALAEATKTNRRVLVDFEATWCGPCKTMDEWIWTDAEVASAIQAGFVGVKLDGDIEDAIVAKYQVVGYPTMMVLDATGREETRGVGYRTSTEMLSLLAGR